eukprot:8946423-Pyramimonas_sp.AAC.1
MFDFAHGDAEGQYLLWACSQYIKLTMHDLRHLSRPGWEYPSGATELQSRSSSWFRMFCSLRGRPSLDLSGSCASASIPDRCHLDP